MQHSAIRKVSEPVTIFASTNSDNNECSIWSLLSDGTYSQIQYTPNIQSIDTNLYSTDIVLPDYDCTLFILFKLEPIVISVGNPDKYFIYYAKNENETIPYEHIYNNGSAISSGNLTELISGFYCHKVEGYSGSIVIVDDIPYEVKIPYNTNKQNKGSIKIQNDVWQLISIPVKGVTVKEYFVDRLASKYSILPEDIVDICTAYFGDENRFRSYIPGITNPSTTNNFPLVYGDGLNLEITGFWVKTKDVTGLVPDINNIIFEWSSS